MKDLPNEPIFKNENENSRFRNEKQKNKRTFGRMNVEQTDGKAEIMIETLSSSDPLSKKKRAHEHVKNSRKALYGQRFPLPH